MTRKEEDFLPLDFCPVKKQHCPASGNKVRTCIEVIRDRNPTWENVHTQNAFKTFKPFLETNWPK